MNYYTKMQFLCFYLARIKLLFFLLFQYFTSGAICIELRSSFLSIKECLNENTYIAEDSVAQSKNTKV